MAKKKIEIPLRAAGDVPSGDVNVTYNGVRIAGLSESTSATLKTEMNVVEHDIELEYTKPAGETVGNVLTLQNNSATEMTVMSIAPADLKCIIVDSIINQNILVAESNTTVNAIVLCYRDRDFKYYTRLTVVSSDDDFNVTVNGIEVPFGSDTSAYSYISSASDEPIVGQAYTVVVSDKSA